MAILSFAIGALLTVCGFGSLAVSVNLVPTEMGMLYALSGVILLGCGGISLSVAAMIARIDRIVAPRPRAAEREPESPPAPPAEPAPRGPSEDDDEVNLNRSGHLPSLREVEQALAEPEGPPVIVGRYAAGGANYLIFSDGTIEAETDTGGYRFASMSELKAYLANRKS